MDSFLPDGTFDVFVLGPMTEAGETTPNCVLIKTVAEGLLREPKIRPLLRKAKFKRAMVTAPEHLGGSMIVPRVIGHLESADFVIIDLSPFPGADVPSPNVMYELALVHALGLPHVLLKKKKGVLPFYVTQNNVREVDFDHIETIEAALRPVLQSLLEPGGEMFAENGVSAYFGGAALIDISAAAGLAVGYYDAFIDFLIRNGGYMQREPGRFRHVVCAIPIRFDPTAEQDQLRIEEQLASRGLKLEKLQLPEIDGKPRGMLVKYVGPVVVDLVTAAYAMRRSPRLIKLDDLHRSDGPPSDAELKMHARLRYEFIRMIRYSVRQNSRHRSVASNVLHYCTPDQAAAVIERLQTVA